MCYILVGKAISMEKRTTRVNIFDYTDYRKYLLDFYTNQKQSKRAFSYRFFARKAGINSVGLYKDVVEGRQNLGRALVFKFSAAMGHSKKEAEYFENMVYLNEARTVEERKLFFERMMASQTTRARIVETTKYEYYLKWYYSAVRALMALNRYKDDPEDFRKIAKTLNPQITPAQAKKAVKMLENLGFVRRDESGVYCMIDQVISTGSLKHDKNIATLNVVNFQKEMMKLAQGAFDRFSSDKLNMSTMTLGISESTLAQIKDELAAVRNKIAGLAENDTSADRIFQLNIQLFPMTDKSDRTVI
jgi:uncharacterized protein (TIGR02147 family)